MCQWIVKETQGNILSLRFNRPDKKNALNLAMYSALVEALCVAERDESIRALVLSGEGGQFTSGNDLADFANVELTSENPIVCFLKAWAAFPKPKIVAVQGSAVGIGSTLLLHSDLVYAESDSQFCMPFVPLGLCPEYASSYLLPRLLGHQRAFELLVLAESINAQRAYELGLVNGVVEDAVAKANEQAQRIAVLPPKALRASIELLRKSEAQAISTAMDAEFDVFARALTGAEFSEALSAFFEKRQPKF